VKTVDGKRDYGKEGGIGGRKDARMRHHMLGGGDMLQTEDDNMFFRLYSLHSHCDADDT
jgi:hypothetical protein